MAKALGYDLSRLKKPDASKPLYATIAGATGVGKTTLAALMPKPLFARFEDGTRSIVGMDDVWETPVLTSKQDILGLINELTVMDAAELDRKTFIIDSITAMNAAFEKEVLAENKTDVLARCCGGYGNAFGVIANIHADVTNACYDLMIKKNMNIIYLAHTKIEKINPPDADLYSRFAIDVPERALACYDAKVDMVAYIKHKFFVKEDAIAEGLPTIQKGKIPKKAIGNASVVITCYYTPSSCGKNRYNITEDIPFVLNGVNPLAQYCVE